MLTYNVEDFLSVNADGQSPTKFLAGGDEGLHELLDSRKLLWASALNGGHFERGRKQMILVFRECLLVTDVLLSSSTKSAKRSKTRALITSYKGYSRCVFSMMQPFPCDSKGWCGGACHFVSH